MYTFPFRSMVLVVVSLLGCAGTTPTDTMETDPCDVEAQKQFLQSVSESAPQDRAGLFKGFVERCPLFAPLVMPMLDSGGLTVFDVELPKRSQPEVPPPPVRVHISSRGVTVNDGDLLEREQWAATLPGLLLDAANMREVGMILSAERDVTYGDITAVMRLASRVGIANITFALDSAGP